MNKIDVLAFFGTTGTTLVREDYFEGLIEAIGGVDIPLMTGHIEGIDNVVAETAFVFGSLFVGHGGAFHLSEYTLQSADI